MSHTDFDISEYQDVVYKAILELHRADGIPWSELTEYAGYKGPASLKNIVQQRTHDLEFSRGLRLMREVSVWHNNKRLHKHAIDGGEEMIVRRPKIERAKGDMTQETLKAMGSLSDVAKAIRMNDTQTLEQSYTDLQIYLCRLKEEIDCSKSVIASRPAASGVK